MINKLPSSDENARPVFPGEKHAILKLPNGKMGVANYMGPGTHVVERVQRRDPPRTEMDKVSMAHDIRYNNAKTKEEIRAADRKFIQAADQVERQGKDSMFNIRLGRGGIKVKMALEDRGVNVYTPQPGPRVPLLDSKLAELQKVGYGRAPGKRKVVIVSKKKGAGKADPDRSDPMKDYRKQVVQALAKLKPAVQLKK